MLRSKVRRVESLQKCTKCNWLLINQEDHDEICRYRDADYAKTTYSLCLDKQCINKFLNNKFVPQLSFDYKGVKWRAKLISVLATYDIVWIS